MRACEMSVSAAEEHRSGGEAADVSEGGGACRWMGRQRGCVNVPYSDTYIPVQPNLPPPNQPHKSEREHNNVSESASTSNKEEKKAVNCV